MNMSMLDTPSLNLQQSRNTRAKYAPIGGAAAIFILTLACHLPMLGNPPLAGTEGHRVFPSLEMVRTGDWILPRLFGQLYLIKPPLHDWLIATAQILAHGHGNELVWRLPSVLEAALLNLVLYLFGYRWFGRLGGLASGLCGLGLIALWGQSRTADVDSTNTLTSTLALMCLIELHFGRPKHQWLWITGAGLSLAAAFLNKGPTSLPIIFGELLYVFLKPGWNWSIGKGLKAGLRKWAPPRVWLPLLIGLIFFGAYSLLAYLAIRKNHLHPDYSGFEEVGKALYINSFTRLGEAVFCLLQVFAFTLPISIALILVFIPGYREAIRDSSDEEQIPRLRLVDALAWSVLIAWGICFMTMVNPRYAYVTVPPLALLAGALVASVPYQRIEFSSFFRALALVSIVVLAAGNWFLIAASWKGGLGHLWMICGGILATLVALSSFLRLRRGPTWTPAWGLPVLLVLAAVPFSYQFRVERYDRSGYEKSALLRSLIKSEPVLTGAAIHSQPELFAYAGLKVDVPPTFSLQNPDHYRRGIWVALGKEECGRWLQLAGKQLFYRQRFFSHKYPVIVAYYANAPLTTLPATGTTLPSPGTPGEGQGGGLPTALTTKATPTLSLPRITGGGEMQALPKLLEAATQPASIDRVAGQSTNHYNPAP